MDWPNTAPFLAAGEAGQITYMRGTAIVAWQIVPTLSIAAGPTLNYSEVELKLVPGFVNHFQGHATDAGYTAGLLYHPWEQHYFGFTYRSATEMNYNGHTTDLNSPGFRENVAASADFHYPETLVFGYSYRPSPKWNLETDVNWTDWSALKHVPMVSSPPQPAADAVNFNWRPSWMPG
jgi:long-chain fatty acid transport protein